MRTDIRLCTACFVVAGFLLNIGMQALAQQANRKTKITEESYSRPEPTRPIKPEIPEANRYRQDKIFLEYADSLFKVETRDTVERQIVKGNVKFRQAGMWMYCDSAYYYPELNSLDAFGNVRMEQGDTLFVYADKLFYEGNERMARLKNGPSNSKVRLINKDVTLTTDSLDYSIAMELGWYSRWGVIDDKVNTLTSLYGEYSPGTKIADFYHDVELINNKDGYRLLTDTLHYNTDTHIANIESLTEIQGRTDTIFTKRGVYNTDLGHATLLSRSMIVHKDSNNNVTTLEGDSIIYDKITRISRAYMFSDPLKHSMPMVLTDTAHKTTLIGGFGIYNDSTREALACEYPLLIEYSQGDSIFLRSDTIKTYIITEMIATGKKKTKSGFPEYGGEIIVRTDSNLINIDSLFFTVVNQLCLEPLRLLSSAIPSSKDNIDKKNISLPEKLIPEEEMSLDTEQPDISDIITVTDSIKVTEIEEFDPIEKVPVEFHVALAYHRARFFKQDLQGVADSIVFVERDSMMYMFRKPIVWSGERQVTGNRIDVHFNDSTADWALLPESGLMSEHVDEDFYNQLAGKKMFATFADNTLKRLEVSGNVETIFLPQEKDSTYNRVVFAESSYLIIDMKDGEMEKLKMWPEVTGNVTPIFLMKKQNQYLQNFRWWDSLRPVREWYGDRWHWADDLGEIPEQLDMYFNSPSDFGNPKSFPPMRTSPASGATPLSSSSAAGGLGNEQTATVLDDISDSEKDLIEEKNESEIISDEIMDKVDEVVKEEKEGEEIDNAYNDVSNEVSVEEKDGRVNDDKSKESEEFE